MENGFGVPAPLLRSGEGPAGERMSIGTQAATHVDAPYHYNSVIRESRLRDGDEFTRHRRCQTGPAGSYQSRGRALARSTDAMLETSSSSPAAIAITSS